MSSKLQFYCVFYTLYILYILIYTLNITWLTKFKDILLLLYFGLLKYLFPTFAHVQIVHIYV